MKYPLTVSVNGVAQSLEIEPHRSLVDVLRNEIGVTGPKEGCDDSECGACMVLVDGKPVNACSYLALQTDQREVVTIEGIAGPDGPDPIQEALLREGGVQCGFCTPGMVISARALLDAKPCCNEDDVRRALAGNLCRCTGYQKIIKAVLSAADGNS
jgi:aerobic-type carbon monoxide dehydrogenase small subunit (CoxS/CutS family)